MDRNTKQLMAVFSLMVGISWGIPYMVSDADERNAGWLMLAVMFLLIALGFYAWLMREQRSAEDAAGDALDAAEENLKKLEDQANAKKSVPIETVEVSDDSDAESSDDYDPQTGSDAQDDTLDEKVEVKSIEEIEEVAEDAKKGDPMAEAEIADSTAAPETAAETDVVMDNDTAADSALADSVSTEASKIDVELEEELIAEEADEIANDVSVDANELEDDAVEAGGTADLTIIEGIGPKYAEILTGAGITTFAQVAKMSEDEIVDTIKSNGGRKSASMGTWAEQAALATKGDWDGLAKLQDELNGGRR